MKRWISGLLALILAAALCAGCGGQTNNGGTDGSGADAAPPSGIYYDITGIDPKLTVMEVDGNAVPAEQYLYWVAYNCSNLEYQISMSYAYYGLYGEIFDEEGNLQWDTPADFLDGMSLSQYAKNQAEGAVRFYATLENLAKEHSVTITEEDEASLAEQRAAAVEQMGSEEAFQKSLSQMGITEETYSRISESNFLFNHLQDLVLEEGSGLYLDPADYGQYVVYADHILLATVDLASGEALSEEEAAAKRETAEDLLSQLQAAEDLEDLFTQLADEYSEDTGRAANPDGYVFGSGEMVQEFEDAAFALAPGEVSGIVETTYGYHIILRKDLTEEKLGTDRLSSIAQQHLSEIINHRAEIAETVSDEVVDTLDVGNFYSAYQAVLEELNAANELETGAGSETDTGSGASEDGAAGSEDGESADE